jgi:hypothetical protein
MEAKQFEAQKEAILGVIYRIFDHRPLLGIQFGCIQPERISLHSTRQQLGSPKVQLRLQYTRIVEPRAPLLITSSIPVPMTLCAKMCGCLAFQGLSPLCHAVT